MKSCAATESAIAELPSGDAEAAAAGAAAHASLATLRETYFAKVKAAELAGLVRTANSHLTHAFDMLDHHNYEAALVAFNEARSAAAQLDTPDWEGAAGVKAFFDTFSAKARDFSAKHTAASKQREIGDAQRAFVSLKTAAETALSHHMYEESLCKVQEARTALAQLVELVGHDRPEDEKALQAIAVQVVERGQAKEIAQEQREINSALTRAVDSLERYNAAAALEAYGQARDLLAAFSNERRLVAALDAFIKDSEAKLVAFAARYADQILAKETADSVREGVSHLTAAQRLLDHGVEDKALQELQDARGVAASLLASMGATLPAVTSYVEKLAAAEKVFCDKFLAKSAAEAAQRIREAVARARQTHERGVASLDGDFGSLTEAVHEVRADALLSKMAEPAKALAEAEVFAKLVKRSFDEPESSAGGAAGGGKGGGKSGGKQLTAREVVLRSVGGKLPPKQLKSLPKITLGTSVNPNFYKNYTRLNESATGITKWSGEASRALAAVTDFDAHRDGVWGESRDPLERVGDYIASATKEMKDIDANDPTLVAWRKHFDEFVATYNEIIDALTKATKVHKALKWMR